MTGFFTNSTTVSETTSDWFNYGFIIPDYWLTKPDPKAGWRATQERNRVETLRIRTMHSNFQRVKKRRNKSKRWKPRNERR